MTGPATTGGTPYALRAGRKATNTAAPKAPTHAQVKAAVKQPTPMKKMPTMPMHKGKR